MLKTLPVIARELGVPYTTLRDCALRGEFPIIKFGRAWKADQADIDRWIEQAKERPIGPRGPEAR